MSLQVENNSQFVRGKKALDYIERFHLADFDMKKLADGNYELTIPYEDDAGLDKTVDELISAMAMEADDRHCFIEADIYENGTERYW